MFIKLDVRGKYNISYTLQIYISVISQKIDMRDFLYARFNGTRIVRFHPLSVKGIVLLS